MKKRNLKNLRISDWAIGILLFLLVLCLAGEMLPDDWPDRPDGLIQGLCTLLAASWASRVAWQKDDVNLRSDFRKAWHAARSEGTNLDARSKGFDKTFFVHLDLDDEILKEIIRDTSQLNEIVSAFIDPWYLHNTNTMKHLENKVKEILKEDYNEIVKNYAYSTLGKIESVYLKEEFYKDTDACFNRLEKYYIEKIFSN